jgi:hypothetical protein
LRRSAPSGRSEENRPDLHGEEDQEYSWRETATLVSAIVGLVAVVPFIVAQSQLDVGLGDLGVQINLWLHILGSAAVIAIAVPPAAHKLRRAAPMSNLRITAARACPCSPGVGRSVQTGPTR